MDLSPGTVTWPERLPPAGSARGVVGLPDALKTYGNQRPLILWGDVQPLHQPIQGIPEQARIRLGLPQVIESQFVPSLRYPLLQRCRTAEWFTPVVILLRSHLCGGIDGQASA